MWRICHTFQVQQTALQLWTGNVDAWFTFPHLDGEGLRSPTSN